MSLHRVKQVFRQEPHCCSEKDGKLELELVDGGWGEFLVLRATEWAFEDQDEVAELVKELRAMLATAKKETK